MTASRRLVFLAKPMLVPRPGAARFRAVNAFVSSSLRLCAARHSAPSSTRRWYSAGAGNRTWSFDEVNALIAKQKAREPGADKIVLVDVREPNELQDMGKIPGAINIPIKSAAGSFDMDDADFQDLHGFERPARDTTLLFYCMAGIRAKTAAELAKTAGWRSVGEYSGSWLDWQARRGPVDKA